MEKVIEYAEKNICSSIRKILGVAGDPVSENLTIEVVCSERIQSGEEMCNILILFSSIVWQILSSYVNIQDWYRKTETAIRDLAYSKLDAAKTGIWDLVQVKKLDFNKK